MTILWCFVISFGATVLMTGDWTSVPQRDLVTRWIFVFKDYIFESVCYVHARLVLKFFGCLVEEKNKLVISAPMIYTEPYIMFWMCADPLQGQVGGGWALEIETFLGPVKWHQTVRWVHLGPKKVKISKAQPTPTCPSNGIARIKNFTYRAIEIIGTKVVLCTRAHRWL
jgi:hypothetical protein